jgi:16S rRNA (cytidine1402-2'-O)-methyltransferase
MRHNADCTLRVEIYTVSSIIYQLVYFLEDMAKSKSTASKTTAGKLSVVATPIGNFEDITLRGLNALRNADVIVCEEMKEANRLLSHYEIDKEVIELNEHNDTEMTVECMKMLSKGKSLALISDAGTPLLADPGDMLVKAAIKYNINVEVVPGASSILTALVRSGLPTSQFLYVGFLSRKSDERNEEIKLIAKEKRTLILLDTPYRLPTVITALAEVMPERQAYLGVNLTMPNEAHYYGTLAELSEHFGQGRFKNEYVIVVDGLSANTEPMNVVNPPAYRHIRELEMANAEASSAKPSADESPKRKNSRQKQEELIVIPNMSTTDEEDDGPQPGNVALPPTKKIEFNEDDDSQLLYSLDEDEAFANFDPDAEDSGFGFDDESDDDIESDNNSEEFDEEYSDYSSEDEPLDDDETLTDDEIADKPTPLSETRTQTSQRPSGSSYRGSAARGRNGFRSNGRGSSSGGGTSAGRYRDRDRDRDYRDRDYRGGGGGRDRDRDYRDNRDYRGGGGGRDRDRDYRDNRDYRGGGGGRDRDRDYRDNRDYRGGSGRDRDRDYRDNRDYRDRDTRDTRGNSRGGFRDDKRDSRPESRGRVRDNRDERPVNGNRANDDNRRTSIIYDSENFGNREEANYSIFDTTDPRNNPRNKNKSGGGKRRW